MKRASDIYALWPSIKSMADDLDESPKDLIERRSADELPDERHDKKILARALWANKYLKGSHLASMRQKAANKAGAEERKDAIRDFYEAAGGTPLLARKMDTTTNALRVAQSRARLPKAWKYDAMEIAKSIGHKLDASLFETV